MPGVGGTSPGLVKTDQEKMAKGGAESTSPSEHPSGHVPGSLGLWTLFFLGQDNQYSKEVPARAIIRQDPECTQAQERDTLSLSSEEYSGAVCSSTDFLGKSPSTVVWPGG